MEVTRDAGAIRTRAFDAEGEDSAVRYRPALELFGAASIGRHGQFAETTTELEHNRPPRGDGTGSRRADTSPLAIQLRTPLLGRTAAARPVPGVVHVYVHRPRPRS